MNKKLFYAIIFVVIIIIGGIYLMMNNSKKSNDNIINIEDNSTGSTGSKVLVVYYSASGNTESVAKTIAGNLKADLFELIPKDVYTNDDLDWTNSDSRVSKENADESLRDVELVTTSVEGWENYDTILIGYPIWWGIAAWPVNNFVKSNDFTGKTVIPFCTAYSSGLGQSGELLEEMAGTGNWLEGKKFGERPTDTEIKAWTDTIK